MKDEGTQKVWQQKYVFSNFSNIIFIVQPLFMV